MEHLLLLLLLLLLLWVYLLAARGCSGMWGGNAWPRVSTRSQVSSALTLSSMPSADSEAAATDEMTQPAGAQRTGSIYSSSS